MKKTGIFYGSDTGTTAEVAKRIAKQLGVAEADVHDVAKTAPTAVADYDKLVLGTSTWGSGELEQYWEDFLPGIEVLALPGKEIALFGCGDTSMSDTFCDGVGELYDRLQGTGAKFVGAFPCFCYDFAHSKAVKSDDGNAVGLLLDEVNHANLSDERIEQWCKTIA